MLISWAEQADMPNSKLTNDILTAAIEGFEAQKRRIDDQIAELRQQLRGQTPAAANVSEAPTRKRRKLSPEGRKAIAEAARKRWAAVRQGR
jgi:hypothetical protein